MTIANELHQIECEGGIYEVAEGVVIDETSKIGPNTKIWSGAKIFPEAQIGSHCVIGAGVHIEHGVKLGNFCKVQRGVTLYSGVEAEDYVFFGPNVTTTNDRNPRAFGKCNYSCWNKNWGVVINWCRCSGD